MDAQLGEDFFQPFHAFAQTVQQRHLRLRAGDGQGHAGKSRAAAHIDDFFSPQIGGGEHRQAVQQMELCHLVGLGDGGEVHDLVLFDHGRAEIAEGLAGAFRQVKPQLGQTRVQSLSHHGRHLALTMPLRSTWVSS